MKYEQQEKKAQRIMAVIMLLVAIGYIMYVGKDNLFSTGEEETLVETFQYKMKQSGKASSNAYEVVVKDKSIEAKCETLLVKHNGAEEVVDTMVYVMNKQDVQALSDILCKETEALEWNGFGKDDTVDAASSESFTLSFRLSDGTMVEAKGATEFPEGYALFLERVEAFFAELEAKK